MIFFGRFSKKIKVDLMRESVISTILGELQDFRNNCMSF